MKDGLLSGERLDDLQRDGLMLIQNPKWFCFGMDAVLLSSFACVPEGKKVLDLGCGNGIIPILLSAKTQAEHIEGLEIQTDIADMARRSVEYNKLDSRVHITTGDIKEAAEIFGAASFDVVTTNPPYMSESHGLTNPTGHKAIARHELKCTLEDVLKYREGAVDGISQKTCLDERFTPAGFGSESHEIVFCVLFFCRFLHPSPCVV